MPKNLCSLRCGRALDNGTRIKRQISTGDHMQHGLHFGVHPCADLFHRFVEHHINDLLLRAEAQGPDHLLPRLGPHGDDHPVRTVHALLEAGCGGNAPREFPAQGLTGLQPHVGDNKGIGHISRALAKSRHHRVDDGSGTKESNSWQLHGLFPPFYRHFNIPCFSSSPRNSSLVALSGSRTGVIHSPISCPISCMAYLSGEGCIPLPNRPLTSA